jgi:tetratricopeptide (TPR) repeat protein
MRISLFKIIFCCISLSFLTYCGSRGTVNQRNPYQVPAFVYYNRALNFVERQQFESALAQMDTAIILKPEFAQFHYAKGQIYEIMGQESAAIKAYETAIHHRTLFPDALKGLGRLYMHTGNFERAVQALKNLTESQPDSLLFELLLADAYVFADKPLLALERIHYFEKSGGNSVETYRLRGMASLGLNDYQPAIQNLEFYIEQKPESFNAQKYLGMANIDGGRFERGISHLNKALSIQPDDPEIYLYRAKYFIQMNKYGTALDQFKIALDKDSNNSVILLAYSKFHLMTGDTAAAEELLNRAVRHNTSCWECFKCLGIIADEQNRDFEALLYLQKYLTNIYYRDKDAEIRLNRLLNNKK